MNYEDCDDLVGCNVYDLVVFLYVQSYKRLMPKGRGDSAVVADVWPSTSAFDGFLSALSPLQVVVLIRIEFVMCLYGISYVGS